MPEFTVTGEASVQRKAEDGEVFNVWEPFEGVYTGATKAEARWRARRDLAPGSALGELEAEPSNPEREKAEIADEQHPRTAERSEKEVTEYERLVHGVKIESVTEGAG